VIAVRDGNTVAVCQWFSKRPDNFIFDEDSQFDTCMGTQLPSYHVLEGLISVISTY
jgi:hypothetical protein